jgi:SAM-dependent methyltransferase
MLKSGLQYAIDRSAPHLGGNVKAGDPYTYCPSVWDYVIARFCIRSVLDLGSGCGNAANYFHKAGLGVIAVDGLPENVATAFYPTVLHDLTNGPIGTRVDLVHCQEVVEHIEEQYLDHLLDSLLCGRIILMTHALPEQGGYHHVNLQPPEYWIDHLERRGCSLLEADTARVRDFASKDDAAHMARTGLVFINSARV